MTTVVVSGTSTVALAVETPVYMLATSRYTGICKQ